VEALQRHGTRIFGEAIPALGVPLYTDARHYARAGVPVVLYGAGPRTLEESNAKRAFSWYDLSNSAYQCDAMG